MPRETPNVPAATPSTALEAMPDDVRADLLRAQTAQITTFQRLPRIKIVGAGAGLFEFTDTNDTTREIMGVILNSHPRNVLWDRDPDDQSPIPDDQKGPACNSNDGRFGTPRAGFLHVELGGRAATGTERIDCSSCRYNQWNSIALIKPEARNTKGKAVTNQRSLYILVDDRETPMELILSPSSLKAYDAYLTALANRSIPIQAVLTKFTLEVKGQGPQRYSVCKFNDGGLLDGETFALVMRKRQQYQAAITPPAIGADAPPAFDPASDAGSNDDDAPF